MPTIKTSTLAARYNDPDVRAAIMQKLAQQGYSFEDDTSDDVRLTKSFAQPGDSLRDTVAPLSKGEYLRKSVSADPRTTEAARFVGPVLGSAASGAMAGGLPGAAVGGASAALMQLLSNKAFGPDTSDYGWKDVVDLVPVPGMPLAKRIATDALLRGGAATADTGSLKKGVESAATTAAAGAAFNKIGDALTQHIKKKGEDLYKNNQNVLDTLTAWASKNGILTKPTTSQAVQNAQEISKELGGEVLPNRIKAAIVAEENYPALQEKHRIARDAEKLQRDSLERAVGQKISEADDTLAVVREARDKRMGAELNTLEAELKNEVERGAGRNSPKALELRAKIEQVKNTYAAPSAREQQILSQQNRLETPLSLEDFDNKVFIEGQKRTAAEVRAEKKISYLDALSSKTGIDVRNMTPAQIGAIRNLAKNNPQTFYQDTVEHLFKNDTLHEMREKGAPAFKQLLNEVQQLTGKNIDEVMQGIRGAFHTKIFSDVDDAGLLKNPVSLRYRVEAVGKDAFNQIYTGGGASGGDPYDTMMDLLKIVGNKSIKREARETLGFTGSGFLFVKFAAPLRNALDIHLDKDAPSLKSVGAAAAHGAGIGATFGGVTSKAVSGSPVPGMLIGGGIGALLAGGSDAYTWSVHEIMQQAANKNSPVAQIIKILANPEQYSSANVQVAAKAFQEMGTKASELVGYDTKSKQR